jgi:hypothetical protein
MDGTTTTMFADLTTADLQGVLNEVKSLVPIVLPVVIMYLAFRKGWSFILKAVKCA